MNIKPQINAFLNTKMDRKGFLKTLALGAIAMTGIASVLRLLESGPAIAPHAGYGGSAYGGQKAPDVTSLI